MINEHCPSCGCVNSTVIYDVLNPVEHAEGLLGLVRKCRQCNLLFKSFEQKPTEIYNEQYASLFKALEHYSGTHVVDFFTKILINTSIRIKKINPDPELLDIGSGVGIMLETAKLLGFKPTGLELSADLAAVAIQKGYTVINKDVSEISITEKFDVISMMDIIEHLEDPKDILIKLKQLIKPEGELIVYTPNHNSLIVKIADLLYRIGIKSPVENIFACTHTCFFTTDTLRDIITKSGYKIIEEHQFEYDTSRPGQKISAMAKIGINLLEKFGALIGLGGFRVVMYAKPIK